MANNSGALFFVACALATTSFSIGGLAGAAATDYLPRAFNQAASVGRFTQEQAAAACAQAQARLNRQLKDARGDNAFTPAQTVDFNCEQAAVTINNSAASAKLSPNGP